MRTADTMAAKTFLTNAVNRVEFGTDPALDGPWKQLAACVILQAILDDLENERKGWTVCDDPRLLKPHAEFILKPVLKQTPDGRWVIGHQRAVQITYFAEPDPETHTVPSAMRPDVFRFYADCCGIESDYASLKERARERIGRSKTQHTATAWLDVRRRDRE